MVGREMNQLYPEAGARAGRGDLRGAQRHLLRPDKPERKRVDNVSFKLRKGEILGIAGLVGAGRTELVSAHVRRLPGPLRGRGLAHGQRVDTGTPLKAIRAGFAMVPEDRKQHGIVRDLSVGQNITLAVLNAFLALHPHRRRAELRRCTSRSALKLKTASPFLPITSLSGGNQQKAVLSKMLLTGRRS
jgi:D-xylose transport system ATP-binding protein